MPQRMGNANTWYGALHRLEGYLLGGPLLRTSPVFCVPVGVDAAAWAVAPCPAGGLAEAEEDPLGHIVEVVAEDADVTRAAQGADRRVDIPVLAPQAGDGVVVDRPPGGAFEQDAADVARPDLVAAIENV